MGNTPSSQRPSEGQPLWSSLSKHVFFRGWRPLQGDGPLAAIGLSPHRFSFTSFKSTCSMQELLPCYEGWGTQEGHQSKVTVAA